MKKRALSALCALAMTFSAVPMTAYANDKDSASEVKAGKSYSVSLSDSDDEMWYYFKAEKDGIYKFYSTGETDTKVSMFDKSDKILCSDDDSGEGFNFCVYHEFKAGEEVYLRMMAYHEEGGDSVLNVELSDVKAPNSVDTAIEISLDKPQELFFYDKYQEYWFTFTAPATSFYRFFSTGETDTFYELYLNDEDAKNDNDCDYDGNSGEDENYDSYYQLEKGQKVYFKVSNDDYYNRTSQINVTYDKSPSVSNTLETAFEYKEGTVARHKFTEDGQEFWYHFHDSYIRYWEICSSGQTDVAVTVYDCNFNEVAYDDDSGNDYYGNFETHYYFEWMDMYDIYIKVTNCKGARGYSELRLISQDPSDEPEVPNEYNVDTDRYDDYKISDDLVYQESDDGITIVGFRKAAETINIPSKINGKPVTSIGTEAFSSNFNKTLKTVTLPNTIRWIGYSAFENCTGLTSLNFPDSLQEIGSDCVKNTGLNVTVTDNVCYYQNWVVGTKYATDTDGVGENNPGGVSAKTVTSLSFPEGTKGICSYAFTYCFNLEEVTFPSTLVSIGTAAFGDGNPQTGDDGTNGLPKLSKVTFKGNKLKYIGSNAFCSASLLRDISLPDSVETIGTWAFAYTGIESFKFPASLKDAGFEGLRNLNTIIVPETVEEIKDFSFGFQDAVFVPSTVKRINPGYFYTMGMINRTGIMYYGGSEADYNSKIVQYEDPDPDPDYDDEEDGEEETDEVEENKNEQVVFNCRLKTVSGATYVLTPDHAVLFDVPKNVTSFSIPAKVDGLPVTRIEAGAFKNCKSITSLTIPSNVKEVGDDAFDRCTSLKSISFPKGITLPMVIDPQHDPKDYEYWYQLYYLSARNGIENLFDGCTNLTTITFDKDDPTYMVSGGAIYQKSPQMLVFVPESTEKLEILDGTTSIANCAVEGCLNLKVWYGLPESVTTLDERAFVNSGFTKIVIPDTVTYIGQYCFASMPNLKSAILPSNMKTIPNNLFGGCVSLEQIVIPATVEDIGIEAFYNCQSLKKVYIPSTVGSTGDRNTYEIGKSVKTISFGGSDKAIYDKDNNNRWYKFTAPSEGYYYFKTSGTDDPEITVVDSQGHKLAEDDGYPEWDDDYEIAEQHVNYHMSKGQTVYIEVYVWFSEYADEDEEPRTETITFSCEEGAEYNYAEEDEPYKPDYWVNGFGAGLFFGPDPNGAYTWSTKLMEQVTIYGVKDSPAERFASSNQSGYYYYSEDEVTIPFVYMTDEQIAALTPSVVTSGKLKYSYNSTGTINIVENKTGSADPETIDGVAVKKKGTAKTFELKLVANDKTLAAENATITIGGKTVASKGGKFTLPELPDGKYQMTISAPNFVARTYEVTVSGGAIVEDIKPELHLIGDPTGDGKLNNSDLIATKSHIKSINKLTGYDLECANADGDPAKKINNGDLLAMKSQIKGIRSLWTE